MRFVPFLLMMLVISIPGSIGVIEQTKTIDKTKMSSELISMLNSEGEIEAIVQFHSSIYLGDKHHNHDAATFLHYGRRLVAVVPALYLLWETAMFA